MGHGPQTTGHGPQTTDHRPWATDRRPRATSHRPWATSHRPQTTNSMVLVFGPTTELTTECCLSKLLTPKTSELYSQKGSLNPQATVSSTLVLLERGKRSWNYMSLSGNEELRFLRTVVLLLVRWKPQRSLGGRGKVITQIAPSGVNMRTSAPNPFHVKLGFSTNHNLL